MANPSKTHLARNVISSVGAAITTLAALLFLILFALEYLGYLTNPYLGLVLFIALPLGFLSGLLLIPIGMLRERRRRRLGLPASAWPRIDLNDTHQRRVAFVVVIATLLNVLILSTATYGGIHYMETPAFCGQVCHAVMQPEFVAYREGPHARIDCVECHVGSGARSLIRSKLNGTRQLFLVLTGGYAKPVPTPVRTLRPARDTCEHCHWPEQFHGDKIRLVREYSDDEQNTESVTTLVVHVGGGSERRGLATGIHWHMNLANEIDYVTTDEKRQVIPYVRLRTQRGEVHEYVAEGVTADQIAKGTRRRMDCMDCHSRPAHTFVATPERAVDQAIAAGLISRTLPYVRREAVAAVKAGYPSQDAAAVAINRRMRDFYPESTGGDSDRAAMLDKAIGATQAVYRQNVFPTMNISWGTYANELGHIDFPGCFRCHDDNHKSKDGQVIRQDCDVCHEVKTE